MDVLNVSLTKRYVPAVLLIAASVIVTYFVNSNMIVSNKENGKIINISGRQRMLSQRLVILGKNNITHKSQQSKARLENAIMEIEANHNYLLTKVFTKELKDLYYNQKLNQELQEYISHFKQLLLTQDEKYLNTARAASDKILTKLDQAVKEYEKYAKEQLKTLSNYELYLMLITLFVLLVEIVFIFIPTSKRIEKNAINAHNEQEYIKTIIESNNNAIIAIDWTSKITTYNKKAQEMFGWSKEEMIGTRNLLNIIPQKYRELHTVASKNYLKTGESRGILGSSHELEAVRKDGTVFPILISFGSKYEIENAIVIANISDITARKKSENKLKMLNEELENKVENRTKELKILNENLENLVKEKTAQNTKQLETLQQQSKMASMGEMIGAIAHQWRQPLNELAISIQNLKYDYREKAINEKFIEEFIIYNRKTIMFMSKTIDDFRSFFLLDKTKQNFDVKERTEAVVDMLSAQLKSYNIAVTITGEKFVYNGFPSEYQQVLLNLINNAKDALLENEIENPKIEIVLHNNRVVFRDNAGGIPNDILKRVFEPYFTTKEEGQGTGMGLYISKMIIEDNMGAKLSVENEKDGALFTIDFAVNA